MIFQIPIDLEVEGKIVQAIIDLDTGTIGFTEFKEGNTIECFYEESPVEYKKALLKKLEPMFAKKSLVNFKVSRKNEKMRFISKYLKES